MVDSDLKPCSPVLTTGLLYKGWEIVVARKDMKLYLHVQAMTLQLKPDELGPYYLDKLHYLKKTFSSPLGEPGYQKCLYNIWQLHFYAW